MATAYMIGDILMTRPSSSAPVKFGSVFTPHMVWARYEEGKGWSPLEVTPTKSFSLMPAAAVLHYGQAIFEGMKARRNQEGKVVVFRGDQNAERFRQSARRLVMPEVSDEMFSEALSLFLQKDGHLTPEEEGSGLYLRPYMFAEESFLGVRPANSYIFVLIGSPMTAYFSDKDASLKLWIADSARAAPGGTGDVKAAGNYAGSFTAQLEAKKQNCHQSLFLDAKEQKYIEEAGAMNIMFVKKDGSVVTPPLNGSILPGITRKSILAIGRDLGMEMREEQISIDAVFEGGKSGEITEAFSSGTAVGIVPIRELVRKTKTGEIETISFQGIKTGFPVANRLAKTLLDIQEGRAEDKHGWVKVYA
ncbi:branched-chain amino acid aminotransferase [Acetobacteraceae bacterium]|nr:branched-chain amino acid aminotransferase [Acetobacteraceae bacterium]